MTTSMGTNDVVVTRVHFTCKMDFRINIVKLKVSEYLLYTLFFFFYFYLFIIFSAHSKTSK